ncbi:hypothetical protein D3C75_315910 [compost metagenome]
MRITICSCLCYLIEGLAQVEIVAAYLLTNNPATTILAAVDIKADHLGLTVGVGQLVIARLAGGQHLLFSIAMSDGARPVAKGTRLARSADGPNALRRIVLHTVIEAVTSRTELEIGEATLMPHRLI